MASIFAQIDVEIVHSCFWRKDEKGGNVFFWFEENLMEDYGFLLEATNQPFCMT